MKIVPAALLVFAALLALPALAGDEPEVYTASTTGELVVDTEGRVIEVSLDRKELGDGVMQGFEDRIRTWQFEPVVQDGSPVKAKAKMSLGLIVLRQSGVDGLRLAFEYVHFHDPVESKALESVSRSLSPPSYPRAEATLFVGAQVNLLLRLDPDGRVLDAAAESVNVLGEELNADVGRHARNFSRAAELAARRWTIAGVEGGLARVPVRFAPYNQRGNRWIRTRGAQVDTPEWVEIERAARDAVTLGEGGQPSSARWKLLTSLDG